MIMRTFSVLFVAASLASLTACGGGHPASPAQPGSASSSSSLITNAIDHALDKASASIAHQDITISSHDANVPDAKITPQGDFLIAGKSVPLTTAQRKEVLAYRQQVMQIVQQGMEVAKQGAAVGMDAASTAIAGALTGQSDKQIQKQVEAQTSGIRQAAVKICDRLPAMMAGQQKLAVDLPAFKPYADMTQADIDECRDNALHGND